MTKLVTAPTPIAEDERAPQAIGRPHRSASTLFSIVAGVDRDRR